MTGTLSQQWLNRAEEDLAVARLVLAEQYTAHACFLSQQCIEKALKAFLLTVVNRYPDGIPGGTSGGVPNYAEAREAVNIAEEMFVFVKARTA